MNHIWLGQRYRQPISEFACVVVANRGAFRYVKRQAPVDQGQSETQVVQFRLVVRGFDGNPMAAQLFAAAVVVSRILRSADGYVRGGQDRRFGIGRVRVRDVLTNMLGRTTGSRGLAERYEPQKRQRG